VQVHGGGSITSKKYLWHLRRCPTIYLRFKMGKLFDLALALRLLILVSATTRGEFYLVIPVCRAGELQLLGEFSLAVRLALGCWLTHHNCKSKFATTNTAADESACM